MLSTPFKKRQGGSTDGRIQWLTHVVMFGFGCLIGSIRNNFSFQYCDDKPALLQIQGDSRLSAGTDTGSENHKDQKMMVVDHDTNGWNTISVFYGKVPLNADETMHPMPEDAEEQSSHHWYAQAHQDEIVLALLNQKRKGYFIDLAANEARYISNTYALERYYDWTGLCIEANPQYWVSLARYRTNCQIVSAVVGKTRMEGRCVVSYSTIISKKNRTNRLKKIKKYTNVLFVGLFSDFSFVLVCCCCCCCFSQ
jgi:hypothetical protein